MSFNSLFFIFIFSILSTLAQDCRTILTIKSDFELVNIFINDSLVSENGNYQAEIEKGVYIIIADEVSDRWNSKTFIDTIQIKECDKIDLNYFFRYKNKNNVFENRSGFDSQDKYYMSDSAYNVIEIMNSRSIKKEKFIDSYLFKILSGSAILLGGTTAHFKIKADKYFDEYLLSQNKEKLDKTRKYDLISGITLAAFQINFGYILLQLLLE
jgi:hypothetical protein